MASSRRAVITGIGVITPLGLEVSSFWEGLRQGRSGVGRVESFDTSALPVHIGAEVKDFDARNYLEKKERKRLGIMVRTFQFAVAAAQLAMEDGLVDKPTLDPTRFGVVVGSATIPGDLRDLGAGSQASCARGRATPSMPHWGDKGIPLIPPLWMLTHIPNMMACHVSILPFVIVLKAVPRVGIGSMLIDIVAPAIFLKNRNDVDSVSDRKAARSRPFYDQ